jgi:hypothetical protein
LSATPALTSCLLLLPIVLMPILVSNGRQATTACT